MNRIIVTSYNEPDLDGTASAIAYAEFLQAQGKPAVAAIYGTPTQESLGICKWAGVTLPPSLPIEPHDEIILIDVADARAVPPGGNIEQVVEVIDHHEVHEADKFIKAKVQIELIGAAVTLVCERMRAVHFVPSQSTATLLYGAIISNTINFKADMTNERDHAAAQWLTTFFEPSEEFFAALWASKTFSGSATIQKELIRDFKEYEFGDIVIGIAQLETIQVAEIVEKYHENLLATLEELFKRGLTYGWISMIDIEKGTTTIITRDEKNAAWLSQLFAVPFKDRMATLPKIMMRKQMWPLVKKVMETR